ncbi:hypothetical protein [Aminivibrio sp.]|jgi:hypothetical protein|uniref:hypothetical protein n=1 Tax=Aminivibrio sp. TaxID=1872489 RepID=UPI001A3DFC2E|nr:hypothetical protein [Aminivibrio sp.]MBL3540183.1 hypothetical protein [Aminivibrio sp.]MDK2959553.1 hypothetical protein [Synergistaceae bacterium]
MKKTLLGLVLALFAVCAAGGGAYAEEQQSTVFIMGRVERLLYGSERTGGLIERLNSVEKEMFGRELPGSISERQNALLNFIEKGAPEQPSLLFKLGVAEWALGQRINSLSPAVSRVEALEVHLEGTPQVDRPVSMRLERILGILLSDTVTMQDIEVPAGMVVRGALSRPLSPKTAKKDDVVDLTLENDLTVGTSLVAPRGSRMQATVTEVTKPRSFGRPSEVKISVEKLFPLGPEEIFLTVGENAKKATEAESAQMAAAGTSVVGAILLGPIGLAGGFLVRGDLKEIPEGTVVFAETADIVRVSAYPVPQGLQGMLKKEEPVPEEKKEPDSK